MELQALREKAIACTKCSLCETRHNVVFGEGDEHAKLMFIGEGPGADEDRTGKPFVGRAGQLLDKMLDAMGVTREEIYIANIVKCRPPRNRNPKPEEAKACIGWLRSQVSIIQPKVIVCLGSVAAQYIMEPNARISRIHGQLIHRNGYIITGTYHPAALLRNEELKIAVWKDLRAVRDLIKEKDV